METTTQAECKVVDILLLNFGKYEIIRQKNKTKQKKGHTRRKPNISNLLVMEVGEEAWSWTRLGQGNKGT